MSQTKTQLIDGIVVDAIGNVNIDSNTFYVDAANNRVGLGTSSPDARLQVNAPSTGRSYTSSVLDFSNIHLEGITAGTTTSALTFSSGGGGGAAIAFSRGAGFQTEMSFWTCSTATTNSATERMRLDSSGRLGIGTTSPAQLLHLRAAAGSSILRIEDSGANAQLDIKANAADGTANIFQTQNSALTFGTNNTERARIDSSGRLLVGTTSATASEKFGVVQSGNGSAGLFSCTDASLTQTVLPLYATRNTTNNTFYFMQCYNTTATANRLLIADSGNVTNANNSYTGISDIKLKENIADANSQWSDIKLLQVRNYNFKKETGQATHCQIGLIAQEVEQICPNLVDESPDRDAKGNDLGTVTKSVQYSVLYMKAVKALQEAMERIEALEAKVTALESA